MVMPVLAWIQDARLVTRAATRVEIGVGSKTVSCETGTVVGEGWRISLTVLSDVEIEKRVREGSLVLSPFDPTSLNGAGYDLRAETDVTISHGHWQLVATLERVELGDDMAATLHIRSSLARAGIIGSLALVDPGFRGQLTISLFNAGIEPYTMKKGDSFVQMVLHLLGTKSRCPYRGRYQNSQGIVERRP